MHRLTDSFTPKNLICGYAVSSLNRVTKAVDIEHFEVRGIADLSPRPKDCGGPALAIYGTNAPW